MPYYANDITNSEIKSVVTHPEFKSPHIIVNYANNNVVRIPARDIRETLNNWCDIKHYGLDPKIGPLLEVCIKHDFCNMFPGEAD